MTNNIAIIVNGNEKVGLGHLIRCLSIAKEDVLKSFNITFFVPVDCKKELIVQNNFEFLEIEFSCKEKILEKLFENHINIILLDLVQNEYQQINFLGNYRNLFFINSITLFDFADEIRFEHLSFFPDFVSDYETIINNNSTLTLKLTGKSYLVINNSNEKSDDAGGDILVSMGGGDKCELTLKTVKALSTLNYKCLILLDFNHKDFNQIIGIVNQHNNLRVKSPTSGFINLLKKFKIVIINGGLTRYEAIFANIPFIAISIHQEQYRITEKLTKHQVGLNLGIINLIDENYIAMNVEKLIKDTKAQMVMKQNSTKLITGVGSYNIAIKIISKYKDFMDEKNYEKS